MINLKVKSILFVNIFLIILISCKNTTENIEVISNNIRANKTYYLDYTSAKLDGFIIPSKHLDSTDYFKFEIKAPNLEDDTLYYKVYYQNESYKFKEINEKGEYNPLASENFYGSWAETDIGFKQGLKSNNKITISFKIVGNPRNEKRYFDKIINKTYVPTSSEIKEFVDKIKLNKKWFNSIKEKALANNYSLDKQLKDDAIWSIQHQSINQRWKRNPRVGKYSLLIVVTDKTGLNLIPEYIKHINKKKDGNFIDPYFFYLYKNKDNKHIKFLIVPDFIKVKAAPPLENGIYVDSSRYYYSNTSNFNNYINNSAENYKKAAFQTYKAAQENKGTIRNLPICVDFENGDYTKKGYLNNIKKFDKKRIVVNFSNSLAPGDLISYDSVNHAITLKNPGCDSTNYKKENVGICTRHGFTYGKYTVKIKMPKLLTKSNVWTGITNAIWLLAENFEPWNNRRICNGEGYMPYYGAPKGSKRIPKISYSEIDFEILKTAEVWPYTSYPDKKTRTDPLTNINKDMICCTNWDMACKNPIKFDRGVRSIFYGKNEFKLHRWYYDYNALTSKYPEYDTSMFGNQYYYFQIEWKPKEIIWRVGPEKDNLHIVGYMNDSVTSIPNNQMIMVITQEYHFSRWWPMAPFQQENIPFPAKDLVGKLYSIEIE